MEQSKINLFLSQTNDKFPEGQTLIIMERLKSVSDESYPLLISLRFKNPTHWLLFYLLIPFFCLFDRLILGDIGLGILKIITLGGFGLWVLIDIFTISGRIRKNNFKKLNGALI